MKPNRYGKYIFKPPTFDSIFLPAPSVVAELLGLPENIVKTIPYLESFYNHNLNVSSSSRANLAKKGAAKPTINKISQWMKQLPIPFMQLYSLPLYIKVRRALNVRSNAGSWFSLVHGLKQSSHDSELPPFMAFINERANTDYLLLRNYKKSVKLGLLKSDDEIAHWAHQQSTWSRASLVPLELLSAYKHYVELNSADKLKAVEQKTQALRAVFWMRLDFYLAAIATYDVGTALYEIRQGSDINFESYDGVFSSVIHSYAVTNEECTCFGAMLMKLRKILSHHKQESSWRALASYISIEESGNGEDKLKDKQYKQLKGWRNGVNMPSDKKLRKFVADIIDPIGDYDIEPTLIYLRIARGIDTMVGRMFKEVENDEKVLPIIAEVLASYPKYFEHFKQQAIKNITH